MVRRSKRYTEIAKLVERDRAYPPESALELVKKSANAKFDETVELHFRTSSDPKHADQLVRGVVVLPYGTGKKVRVVAFAQGEGASVAKEAGADYIGDDEVLQRIEKEGWVDFDVAVATPDMMPKIGRLGRILGRRGLMPNPKAGTVVPVQDLGRVIREAKGGRVEFRMDRTALIHVPIGKVSFDQKHLADNLAALVETVVKNRPSGVKGQFITSAYLKTTMGPSVKLDLSSTLALRVE